MRNKYLRFLQSIRGQLLSSFILMALLPAFCISAGSVISGFMNGRQQTFERLESASLLKQIEIERWLDEIKSEAVAVLTEEYAYDRILIALNLAKNERYFQFYNGAIRSRFDILISQSSRLDALSLLDREGKVVIASRNSLQVTDPEAWENYTLPKTQPAFQLLLPSQGSEAVVCVSIPVFDLENNFLGVLVAQSGAIDIAGILQDSTGLGVNGRAYLLSPAAKKISAADIRSTAQNTFQSLESVHSRGVDTLLADHDTFSGIFNDSQGNRVVGVYRWLPFIGLGLVIEQNLIDAFSIIFSGLTVTILVAVASLVMGVFVALWLTRRIAHPLTQLADAAQQISAGGLTETVKIERPDEIGALARAFNSMTLQLGNLVNRLEQRVRERTLELEEANRMLNRRALQVETGFQVGRQITSILEIQPLLQRIVDLIRQSYGYEQVSIYLLISDRTQLEQQACSPLQNNPDNPITPLSETSLNGCCAILNSPVVVNDVRLDDRYSPVPGLDVLSVLVLPLVAAGSVIGTLEIQSLTVNAFRHEDVLGFQNLADQIAIAIQNAHLYARTRELAIVEERNRLSREMHDSVIQSLYCLNLLAGGWQHLLDTNQPVEISQYLQRVREISTQALSEMRLLVHQLRPPVLEEVGLLDALHQRLEAVEKRAGITARLVSEDILELPFRLEEPIYWIIQEALNNAIKHGSPNSVSVNLRLEREKIVLDVIDDGDGFDQTQAQTGGMGLRTMRERADVIHADLDIQSAPGQGTHVRVSVPVAEEDRSEIRTRFDRGSSSSTFDAYGK